MTRSLASISAAVLLTAAAAQAQCFTNAGGTSQAANLYSVWGGYPIDDEGRSILAIPLGFTFPMPTTVAPALVIDRMWIGSNGHIYLSDSNYGLVNPIQYLIQDLASFRGTAFATPRLLPYSRDLEASSLGGWGIFVNNTTPGQITITFLNEQRYFTPGESFSFSATLYNSGIIEYAYDANMPEDGAWVGVSVGNSVGTGTETNSNIIVGADSGSLGLIWGVVNPGEEVDGKTIRFTPNGLGGYTSSVTCAQAFHQPYGQGCYTYAGTPTEAVYEYFPSPAASGPVLTGQSMIATPTVNGYQFTWGGGTYVAPTGGATILALTDDSETDVTPTIPLFTPFGAVPTLSVCSNGYVNFGPSGNNSVFSYGSVYNLLNSPLGAFRTNADYDPASSPGGAIKVEEIAGILYVTWELVERYATSGVSDTWQFQLNLASGVCVYAWSSMQSTAGGGTALGYAPGIVGDPGSVNLATALPITTFPSASLSPLTLSATPAPVYTIGGSTVPITYTVDNMIDLAPPFGIGVGLLIFSVAPFPGGLDMTFFGIDNCFLNIASLDVIIGLPNTAPQASVVLTIPQPLFPGLSFYSQAVSLFDPNNPLPNGMNAFGATLSNGLQSSFNLF